MNSSERCSWDLSTWIYQGNVSVRLSLPAKKKCPQKADIFLKKYGVQVKTLANANKHVLHSGGPGSPSAATFQKRNWWRSHTLGWECKYWSSKMDKTTDSRIIHKNLTRKAAWVECKMMGDIWLCGKEKAIHKITEVEMWREWNLEEWRHLSDLSWQSQWRSMEMMIGMDACAVGANCGGEAGLQWSGLVIK